MPWGDEDPLWGGLFGRIANHSLRPREVGHVGTLPDANGLITVGEAAHHINVTKTGFRVAVPLPAEWVKRCDNNERLGAGCCHKLRSCDARVEFELRNKLYAWVETAPGEGRKKPQRRKERCVPYDLR